MPRDPGKPENRSFRYIPRNGRLVIEPGKWYFGWPQLNASEGGYYAYLKIEGQGGRATRTRKLCWRPTPKWARRKAEKILKKEQGRTERNLERGRKAAIWSDPKTGDYGIYAGPPKPSKPSSPDIST